MKRLLIDYLRNHAIRTAYLEDRKLIEIFIDYKENGSQVGYIINGVVRNILPSGFAFIDIGQAKNAFMNLPSDTNIKPGQYIPVQVRKDATGDKGANVSECLQFNGRLAVLYPSSSQEVGISQKIASSNERKRLRKLTKRLLPTGYGVILRTNSANTTERDLQDEFDYLTSLCAATLHNALYSTAPYVLYRGNSLLDDLLSDDIEEIIINAPEEMTDIKQAVSARVPSLLSRVRLWDEVKESTTLFDAYDIEQQIAKALHRNIWLPCGGFVTFDQTEACIVIDVNTGKFAGKKNYRETVLRANLEAAACVAAQIALRNLSGMIIVDFIDMEDEVDKRQLINVFDQALAKDRIRSQIVGMTQLGLVQLTRRKKREPLSRLLEQVCPHCNGTGRISKH